ncbi:hypothetical protein A9G11_07205 [Gilliamella sp. wkB108]|uniref:hypothetical protein n=1 Tax=Gilliamella sp. wkB108 TaxID=3120256 RepID=UPI00080E2A1B|nr:hypothetical protein [Gilliamella apicola]OCG22467.1 hypothetical protein A9G11_07205 [Gilliamella apicola]
MSNDVRGYINYSGEKNLTPLISFIEQKYNIGIKKIEINELYNFPDSMLPKSKENKFIFIIGDDNEYYNASFLIDYINYAPESDIGFPIMAKDRLNILFDVMSEIINITNVSKLVITLTDSCEIENIKKIKYAEMREVIYADFETYQAPPDTLYEVIC